MKGGSIDAAPLNAGVSMNPQTLDKSPGYRILGVIGAWPLDEAAVGDALDCSKTANNGVSTNTTVVDSPFFSGKKARNFAGADYITINDNVVYATPLISIDFRFKAVDMTNVEGLVTQRQANNVDVAFTFYKAAGVAEMVRWQVTKNGNDGGSTIVNGTALADGTIYHIAGTFDGALIHIFVNGQEQNVPVALVGAMFDSASAILLGAVSNPAAGFYNGVLANVNRYNAALSAAQIAKLASGYPDPTLEPGKILIHKLAAVSMDKKTALNAAKGD